MKKCISLFAVLCLLISVFSILPNVSKAEENDPLSIDKIIGLTEEVGVFRMAAQDGSHFNPMYQMGMFVADSGAIYIADSSESQIEVLSQDFKPLTHFGGIGKEDGKFMYLTSINICSKGNIYITDSFIGKVS